MMNLFDPNSSRAIALVLFIAIQSYPGMAQKSSRPDLTILERNIRAEMNFLASDAMQGRGSATGYERIAAEYIASQFRQFGLEPAGDADNTGNKGVVQR